MLAGRKYRAVQLCSFKVLSESIRAEVFGIPWQQSAYFMLRSLFIIHGAEQAIFTTKMANVILSYRDE